MRHGALLCACLLFAQVLAGADEPPPPPSGGETVTITRAEWDALQATVRNLTAAVKQLQQGRPAPDSTGAPAEPTAPAPPEAPPTDIVAPVPAAEAPSPPAGGGRALSLPDISLIVQARGKATSDHRDELRNRVRLSEAEIGIQGWVYPNVKADCFIAMSPEEDEPAQVEEAYLSFLSLRPGLNAYVGRKHVAFGRANLLHNHSWPYVRPPLALRNLVAEESLAGDGVEASYVIPTPTGYFAQLDAGAWTGEGPGEASDLPDIMAGPGAGFADRFYTTRLWASHSPSEHSEVELGGSCAWGAGPGAALEGDGRVQLTGVDLSFRHFGEGTQRTLLRAEHLWRRERVDGSASTSRGYYVLGSYRPDKYSSWAALYDWSAFPQAPEAHESALSLIYTRQFSEQYYLRLQVAHGDRPGDGAYDEAWLQWVWGVGPHTHNLE